MTVFIIPHTSILAGVAQNTITDWNCLGWGSAKKKHILRISSGAVRQQFLFFYTSSPQVSKTCGFPSSLITRLTAKTNDFIWSRNAEMRTPGRSAASAEFLKCCLHTAAPVEKKIHSSLASYDLAIEYSSSSQAPDSLVLSYKFRCNDNLTMELTQAETATHLKPGAAHRDFCLTSVLYHISEK